MTQTLPTANSDELTVVQTSPPKPASRSDTLTASEARSAVQWVRQGASDETIKLDLPVNYRLTVSPMITAMRWAALLFGVVFAATLAATQGDLKVVFSLTVCMFLTVWRTFRPLKLAWQGHIDRILPITDGAIIGAAVGISGGFASPFVYCVMAAVFVASLGWGWASGYTVLGAALVAMLGTALLWGDGLNLEGIYPVGILFVMVVMVGIIGYVRNRMVAAERRRQELAGQLDVLTETNDMLGILNEVARTLPASLDMSEALSTTRFQLHEAFDASSISLFTYDEANDSWVSQIREGITTSSPDAPSTIPPLMQQALSLDEAIVVDEPGSAGLNETSAAGLYSPLRARGAVIGVLGVETAIHNRYSPRDKRIVEGLSEALGLTLDNARRFGRLRRIGADEERARIARDLHDRLSQWLSYISLELERIMMTSEGPTESLQALHREVRGAMDELRETLRQLRTGVSPDEPLAKIIEPMLYRFHERSNIPYTYNDESGGASLRLDVENELLRILQESLNNVMKHSKATHVTVTWRITDGSGYLEVSDNGRGFNTYGTRGDSSYGLQGMYERAQNIEASLDVSSEANQGTTVRVTVEPQKALR